MSNLHEILQTHVSSGLVPGAVGLVARGDRVAVQAIGSADVDGTSPMARDSIFRIASITKPITMRDFWRHVGDPAYDLLRHMLNCADRLAADPAGLADRMAGLAGIDDHRARQWLFARSVQEPRDGCTPGETGQCAPGP